jgi:speckle-type POZ protein
MGNISAKQAARATSSVCTTEAATGAHNFLVMNYSLLDGMGVGNFVASSTFSVGGHDWCIRFYPDGDGKEPGYAGVFLCPCGTLPEKGVRVNYTLSFQEKRGRVHRSSTPFTATRTFKSGDMGWGTWLFVQKSYLQGRDCFVIRCDLTVVQNTITQMLLPN